MAPGAACGQIGCNCGAFAPYFFPSLPGRERLPRRVQRRYGATVAHLRRIFLFFLDLQGRECVGVSPSLLCILFPDTDI